MRIAQTVASEEKNCVYKYTQTHTQILNHITSIKIPISRKLFLVAVWRCIRSKYIEYRGGYSFKEERFLLQGH